MDIKIIGTEPSLTDMEKIERENEKSLPQQVLDGDNEGEINHIAVKQVLDIQSSDGSYDEDIGILVEWAKGQVDDSDPVNLKWAIRDLRMRIGTPSFGDSIKHLSRFAYLDLEEKKIKEEKRTFV